jgi:hypothetical protein
MRTTALIFSLLFVACAHVEHREPVSHGSGGFIPGTERLVSKTLLAQAEAPVGAPSATLSQYSYTATAPSGSNGFVLTSGAKLCTDGATCSKSIRWDGSNVVVSSGVSFSNSNISGVNAAITTAAAGNLAVTIPSGAYLSLAGSGATAGGTNSGTIRWNSGSSNVEVFGGFVAAASKFAVSSANGKVTFDATDSSGTPGAATINKPSGQVSMAAGSNSVVVTNSLISTSSVVFAAIQQIDSTCTIVTRVIPAAGSVTIGTNGNCTAATKVGFVVFN